MTGPTRGLGQWQVVGREGVDAEGVVFEEHREQLVGRLFRDEVTAGQRVAVDVDVPTVEGPGLLQAVPAAEGPGAVPADQLLLTPGQRRATLLLRPAHYLVRLETATGVRTYGQVEVTPDGIA